MAETCSGENCPVARMMAKIIVWGAVGAGLALVFLGWYSLVITVRKKPAEKPVERQIKMWSWNRECGGDVYLNTSGNTVLIGGTLYYLAAE